MRLSKLFGKTLREVPAEAETVSHQLLLRSGMIQQVAAGVYSYLPLAWRVLRKMEQIIREEMDTAGGQELNMPVLQPLEIWQESGRDLAFGKGMFTLRDRRERKLVLAPTHEEVITDLARRNVRSYRDLPLMLYQIQTKFRDEPRPRGGLVRVREFSMKDLYSFDADEEALDLSYQKMIQAYTNTYARCGLETVVVEADSGAIGGKDSHEFMVIAETGEDEIIYCSGCDCGYAANAEKAASAKSRLEEESPLPLEEVATPGTETIEEVATYLDIPLAKTLKSLVYWVDWPATGRAIIACIRGDLSVNDVKLKNALKCKDLRLATEEEMTKWNLIPGYVSPVGVAFKPFVTINIVIDDSVGASPNLVAGANKPGYHVKNVNYPRDFPRERIEGPLDIALAEAGHRCPKCGGELKSMRGIEVGHVFKLGTVFSQKQGAFYLDRDGNQKPLVMGCYGIGIGRLLAAAIEQNHDEKGVIWPVPIAPYHIYLCALGMDDPEVVPAAEKLYTALEDKGFEVLFDDRIESAGVKFNDADLLGVPLRVVVSPRTLKSNSVELKLRREVESELVPIGEVSSKLESLLN